MAAVLSQMDVARRCASDVHVNTSESVGMVPQIRIESLDGVCMHTDPLEGVDVSRVGRKTKDAAPKPKKRNKKATKQSCTAGSIRTEGHKGDNASPSRPSVSCASELIECRRAQGSLAKVTHTQGTMERAVIGTSYNSDEWDEDSIASDTEGDDHTDSSDDDDPKSQFDKMIDEGSLLYMEGCSSALSSEGESDDSSDYDSDSDITDVSPILSATASPLGLSPVLPRRAIPISPLVSNTNQDLQLDHRKGRFNKYRPDSPCCKPQSKEQCNNIDATNLDLLMQAMLDLEANTATIQNAKKCEADDSEVFIHPIRANPHHRHLRKNTNRKNMSFSNEDVRKIDRNNKILLKKLMAVHKRSKSTHLHPNQSHAYHEASSYSPFHSYNKRQDDERIRRTNLILLRKIQEARPSTDVMLRRTLSGPTVTQG